MNKKRVETTNRLYPFFNVQRLLFDVNYKNTTFF